MASGLSIRSVTGRIIKQFKICPEKMNIVKITTQKRLEGIVNVKYCIPNEEYILFWLNY